MKQKGAMIADHRVVVLAGLLGLVGLTGRGAVPAAPAAAAQSGAVGTLVLVEQGQSRAPIVVFKDAPPLTRKAADELAVYIEKTTGVKPVVLDGRPDPLPTHAIWVGFQPVLTNLFPSVDFNFKHPEEVLMVATTQHLAIVGRDRWDPAHLTVPDRRGKPVNGIQQEYGTANAVYTFLQDNLGVRWLWPGELGEDVVKKETLSLTPFECRYHPQIRYRSGVFHFSAMLASGGYGRSHDWTRLQRLQLDSLDLGSHAFGDWWERFHKEHPEYFALQPDGTRSGYPDPRMVKICESNPGVWTQWLALVEEDLKVNPNQRVFSTAANDGWATGHCICTNCRAWDHPDGEPRLFQWQGLSQEYVALSDRQVTFANQCARLLKDRFPGKDYYVSMLAYGHSRPAPLKAVPADNVIVGSVANCFSMFDNVDRGSTRGTMDRQQFSDWAQVAPRLMWRPNTGGSAGWLQGQPDVQLDPMIKTFQFMASNHCMGIYIDGVWEHWATLAPQYYLMAQLAWNPAQDGQAILDDYYRRGFGKGAAEIKGYWTCLEQTRETLLNMKGTGTYWEVYNQAFFDKAYGFLDRASASVAKDPERYRQRVAFIRAGLDYTQLIVDVRAGMAQWNRSHSAETEKKVRADWAAIEQLCKDHPYAINWGPIRPQTPRMAGLHPDYSNKKKVNPDKSKKKDDTKKAPAAATELRGLE